MAQQTNFEINGKKYFRIKRVIGHNPDGSPIHKYFYGINKKDALHKYDEWKAGKKDDFNKDTPFDVLADYYIENVLSVSSYAESTKKVYISAYNNHIKGHIDKTIDIISSKDIQKLYNDMKITKATMKSVNKFMVGFFKWLSRNGYCNNLMDNVVMPKKRDNKRSDEIITWTDDELKKIQSNLEDFHLRFFIICAIYTGLRVSELKGLKYSDFRGDFIEVRRQCYNGEIKAPKGNSVRSVPIHDVVASEFAEHKKKHLKEMDKKNYHSDFVFTSDRGNHPDTADLRRALVRYYKRIGVPFKKFHAYRATFCTNLCKAGVPIQIASKLLGHKSVEVTSKYYTSVSDDEKKNAVQKLTLF